MWYLITAILSGAVGAFLMGLVAGAKNQDELNRACADGRQYKGFTWRFAEERG